MSQLRDLHISPRQTLPGRLLSVRFARSGGPGGQHVNKVATKVDLRLNLDGAVEILGAGAVARIRAKLANRLDDDGNLQVVADGHRHQRRNLETALLRMESLLRSALRRPRPRTPTRPSRRSIERRLESKRRRGVTKRMRRKPEVDD